LQVTRAEGDPTAMNNVPVRVDELVKKVIDDCSIEAAAKGCSIRLAPGPAVTVTGDAELLRRAIENVLRNAIRYAPPGTAVEVRQDGATVRVRDFGPGVPEQALPRIFDPFYRVETDRNRGAGGVGLGLSIARRAIELHHGH